MSPYFKPLRRKLGVATLALSCLLTAGWVRSNSKIQDVISFPHHKFRSKWGYLAWEGPILHKGVKVQREYGIESFADRMDLSELMISSRLLWRFCGLYSTKHSYSAFVGESLINVWTIYYKTMVIPLTLLSAWLLLSKPRAAKKLIEKQG